MGKHWRGRFYDRKSWWLLEHAPILAKLWTKSRVGDGLVCRAWVADFPLRVIYRDRLLPKEGGLAFSSIHPPSSVAAGKIILPTFEIQRWRAGHFTVGRWLYVRDLEAEGDSPESAAHAAMVLWDRIQEEGLLRRGGRPWLESMRLARDGFSLPVRNHYSLPVRNHYEEIFRKNEESHFLKRAKISSWDPIR